MSSHESYEHRILTEIGSGQSVSQRSLAHSVGIALGLTNLLVRRLVRKGWVRVVRIRPNRVRYLLTPAGVAAQAQRSRLFLQDSIRFYITARDRIREGLASAGEPSSRIVFYGTGEVAEIAYVCLQETSFELVGVVGTMDEGGRHQFFGLPVRSIDDVLGDAVGGVAFDRLVVTAFENREATRARLEEAGVAPERVHWL